MTTSKRATEWGRSVTVDHGGAGGIGARPHRATCATPTQVDFDLFDAATRDASDEALQSVRDTGCPVVWTEHNGGHWIVSNYELVAAAFRDWERFSSERIHPERTRSRSTTAGSRRASRRRATRPGGTATAARWR